MRDAGGGSLIANLLEHPPHRRSRVVQQVHGHLDTALRRQRDAERLHSRQTSVALPDARRDTPCQTQVLGIELDVPGDEERSRAHDRGTRRGMRASGAVVGRAVLGGQGRRQALEAGSTDVRQDPPIGSGSGTGVQVDGQGEALRQPATEVARKLDAHGHGRVAEGHERDDIQCADTWMLTPLRAQVDRVRWLAPRPPASRARPRPVLRPRSARSGHGRRRRCGRAVSHRGRARPRPRSRRRPRAAVPH